MASSTDMLDRGWSNVSANFSDVASQGHVASQYFSNLNNIVNQINQDRMKEDLARRESALKQFELDEKSRQFGIEEERHNRQLAQEDRLKQLEIEADKWKVKEQGRNLLALEELRNKHAIATEERAIARQKEANNALADFYDRASGNAGRRNEAELKQTLEGDKRLTQYQDDINELTNKIKSFTEGNQNLRQWLEELKQPQALTEKQIKARAHDWTKLSYSQRSGINGGNILAMVSDPNAYAPEQLKLDEAGNVLPQDSLVRANNEYGYYNDTLVPGYQYIQQQIAQNQRVIDEAQLKLGALQQESDTRKAELSKPYEERKQQLAQEFGNRSPLENHMALMRAMRNTSMTPEQMQNIDPYMYTYKKAADTSGTIALNEAKAAEERRTKALEKQIEAENKGFDGYSKYLNDKYKDTYGKLMNNKEAEKVDRLGDALYSWSKKTKNHVSKAHIAQLINSYLMTNNYNFGPIGYLLDSVEGRETVNNAKAIENTLATLESLDANQIQAKILKHEIDPDLGRLLEAIILSRKQQN